MAKEWLSPAEIARDSKVFAAFTLVLCGVATWDIMTHIRFDISIITRKRKWRWPMLLYFICRICMVLFIFAFAVNLNAISEIPCQEVTWISKATDAIGTCCASLILVLRTRAVWHQSNRVAIPLGVLFLGQIAMWCQTFRYSRSKWNPQRNTCAVLATAPKPILIAVFAYTMVFDLVILVLCAYKLTTARLSSTLASVLLRDGILYFCAAFGANMIQMIMASLGFNPVMNIITLPFALVVSVIASTTVFRNVFTIHDSFSEPSNNNSGSGNRYASAGTAIQFGQPRVTMTGQSSNHLTNDIPLGAYKSADVGGISVHRVVDIEVGANSESKNQGLVSDHSSRNGNFNEKPQGW